MLEYFRSRRNPILLYFVVGLVAIVMLTFGIALRQYGQKPTWVMRVANKKVPVKYFYATYYQTMSYFQQMFGGQMDPSFLRFFPVDQMVMNNLKEQVLIEHFADISQFTYSPQFVRDQILAQEIFRENNVFSYDRYRRYLTRGTALSPITPRKYESYVGNSYILQSLNRVVRESYTLTPAQARMLSDLRRHEYKFSLFPLSIDAVAIEFEPSRDRIQAATSEPVNHTRLQNMYFARMHEYQTKDAFQARHILLSVEGDESPEAIKEIDNEITALYETLLASPDQFEALAKAHSQDPGSKDKGGDLGLFYAGDMIDEFEAALRTLKAGEISQPFRTPFGYHIVQLIEMTSGATTPFEEVEEELARDLVIENEKYTLLDSMTPIIVSHLKARDHANSNNVIANRLKIEPMDTGFISPYQADIPELSNTQELKQRMIQQGPELNAGDFLDRLIVMDGISYAIRFEARQDAFGETEDEDDMLASVAEETFLTQIETKWSDNLYQLFQNRLEKIYTLKINQPVVNALKERMQTGQMGRF